MFLLFPLWFIRQANFDDKVFVDYSENSCSRKNSKTSKISTTFICFWFVDFEAYSIFQLKVYHSMNNDFRFSLEDFWDMLKLRIEKRSNDERKTFNKTTMRWRIFLFSILFCRSVAAQREKKSFLLVFWHSSENCSIKISSNSLRTHVELVEKMMQKMKMTRRKAGKSNIFTFHMKKVATFVSLKLFSLFFALKNFINLEFSQQRIPRNFSISFYLPRQLSLKFLCVFVVELLIKFYETTSSLVKMQITLLFFWYIEKVSRGWKFRIAQTIPWWKIIL